MDKIPEDIQYKIYKYKHQLEYKDVMDDLLQKRILCRYNLSLSAVRRMMYCSRDGVLVTCLNIDNIDVIGSDMYYWLQLQLQPKFILKYYFKKKIRNAHMIFVESNESVILVDLIKDFKNSNSKLI